MSTLGDLFGKGSIAEQIFVWGVLNQVIGALASPYFDVLTQDVNLKHPEAVRPPTELVGLVIRGFIDQDAAITEAKRSGISEDKFRQLLAAGHVFLGPADLAQLVVRNFMPRGEAHTEAAKSGLDAKRFDDLVRIAGDAPGPQDLAVAFRRGLIAEDGTGDGPISFAQGIREGRLADKYIPMIRELAKQWPSPVDALQAELEGQLSHEEALATYKRLGGDEQFYTWLFNTRGTAPSPVELGVLFNRRIIPLEGTGPDVTSFRQGILEGPSRNKWFDSWVELAKYITPPRSVVAQIHSGTVTDEQAATELAKSGLTPDEIASYIAEGHARASQTDRNLTQSTIIALYEARIISETDAHNLLTALGFSDDNATYLVTLANLRRQASAVNAAFNRVHNLYVAHKIGRDDAVATLHALNVPTDQVSEVVRIWELEAGVNVRQLTEAQIVNAAKKQVIPVATALAELQTIGYTRYDGWVLLAIAMGPDAGPAPSQEPNPVGTIP